MNGWTVGIAIMVLVVMEAEAGFWSFYMPNFMKPSGYSELSVMIDKIEAELNETIDNFEDVKYFWALVEDFGGGSELAADTIPAEGHYPEPESVCSDVLPLFTSLAKDYVFIDFDHFTKPMRVYLESVREMRQENFPEGPKSKNILPRVWEQKLHELDLSLKLESHRQLTNKAEFREMREKMVSIWKNVKRSLDSSLACVYLKYAYRQMAEDINQFALEYNLKEMEGAMGMIRSAYRRIDRYADSDRKAIRAIEDAIKKEERMHIGAR